VDDEYTTDEDMAFDVPSPGVLGNDSDPKGRPLEAIAISDPENGKLTLKSDGSLRYEPGPGYFGSDSFLYRATNGDLESEPATVTITVKEVVKAPVAMDDEYATDEDVALDVPKPGVLANDIDPKDLVLMAVVVTEPNRGRLTLHPNGSFRYVPEPGFFGTDTFTYKATNGKVESEPTRVKVTVHEVDKPPVATDDEFITDEDVRLEVPSPGVLANDSDPQGAALEAVVVTETSNGSLELSSDGSFFYEPRPGFFGVDDFTYRATNGELDSSPATVRITVNEVIRPPVVRDCGFETDEDVALIVSAPGVLEEASDPKGLPLRAVVESLPASRTLVLNEDGSLSYMPSPGFFGTDSFTFRATNGRADSEPATATITVIEVIKPPVATNDNFVTDEDEILEVASPGVLENDTDSKGAPLEAAVVESPTHGDLDLNADGSFSYAPKPGFFGTDTFIYRATNGELDSEPATVTITVVKLMKPPVVADHDFLADQDEKLEVGDPGVLALASDPRGQELTAVVVSGPAQGTLVLEADGSFSYVPEPGFFGTDTFVYRATNGELDSEPATVTIEVSEVETLLLDGVDVGGEGTVSGEHVDLLEDHPSDQLDTPETADRESVGEPSDLTQEPEAEVSVPMAGSLAHEVVPPPIPESAPQPMPPPLPKQAGERFPSLSHHRLAFLIGSLAVLVVVVAAVLWLASVGETPEKSAIPTPLPTPAPSPVARPTAPPLMAFHPALIRAQTALIDVDSEAVRQQLETITEDEIAALTEEERALYDDITATLEGGERDKAIQDLRGGLSWSSVKMLRRAVAGLADLSAEEVAAVPGLARDLEVARDALRIHSLMYEARENGDTVLLLERSVALIEILPDYSKAIEFREEATASLEAHAETAVDQGDFEEALVSIEMIARLWPDREGTGERLARYRELQEQTLDLQDRETRYKRVLAQAAERSDAGYPDEGLQLLEAQIAPESLTRERDEIMDRLVVQLAEVDGSAPQVALAEDTKPVIRKNQPSTIILEITDDHRVVDAVMMLRVKGASDYQEIRLSDFDGDRYSAVISPELHNNQSVEFYVEALDFSGHVGRLGSPTEPLLVKRKGLFKKILGD
jgi:hypothetical protein